ncbi:MAG: SAM-dependent methyltransferase, partial [Desulfitobacterium hafniense]|nr:SAM-dependent methyltransferase [Desulfitobacterium hafniense]
FYQDHLRIYQKRPIYWLFDSGKKKGFRALVYLHRYTPETLAALRLNYLHELQVKYNGEERRLEQLLDAPGTSKAAKAEAAKQLQALRLKQEELVAYDKVLTDYANRRIAFDMDDGVAANYTKLEALLAKIK